MYVCMYVCMYVLCMYVCGPKYMYTYVCIYACLCMEAYVCMQCLYHIYNSCRSYVLNYCRPKATWLRQDKYWHILVTTHERSHLQPRRLLRSARTAWKWRTPPIMMTSLSFQTWQLGPAVTMPTHWHWPTIVYTTTDGSPRPCQHPSLGPHFLFTYNANMTLFHHIIPDHSDPRLTL